jgi:membrane-associated phospholipid phosphatase
MRVRSPHHPPSALPTASRIAAVLTLFALAIACTPDQRLTAPNKGAEARNGVPFTEGLASPAWQQKARDLVSAASLAAVQATHVYPILGVAQYLAVQQAQATITGGGRERLEADRGAVAGASFVTMSYLFPTPANVQAFQDLLTAQANAGPGQPHPAFAAGEAIGRAVGAQIVARAIADHFNDPNTAVPPAGGTAAGFWTPNLPGQLVAGGTLPGTTPWFLTSSDQFKPAAHPPFGSADFNTALAEIRHISDTRTPEQIHIATIWALSNGTPTTSGFWLAVPTDSSWVAQHDLSERETTHLYALLSATMFDAQIGCWDEKLRSWLVRPWKADPAITTFLPVGTPNHPSYPSGHSCLSASAASVLSMFFPEHTAQLDAMVEQAGLSRMYGGIHYRFDISAGQTLGRNVARFTIAADASGNSILTPH